MATGNPFQNHINHHLFHKSPSGKPYALIILLALIAASLSGCVTFTDPEASQDFTSDAIGALNSQSTIGQSFISRRANLNGITIWLTISSPQSDITHANLPHSINVKLFHAAGEPSPVYATIINTPPSGEDIPIAINLPPQNNPGGQNYYIVLASDSSSILVNGRNEDAFPDGQAYINGMPVNADIAFRLSYDYGFTALIQDITLFVQGAWLIFPLLVLLWLPGWLLVDISGLRRRFDFGEQTALALGISLALIPVLMLWTSMLNIKWSHVGVLFLTGFLVAIFIVRLVYRFISRSRSRQEADPETSYSGNNWYQKLNKSSFAYFFLLIGIFMTGLVIRLIMVRDLATPAWVDSVHHALITRLILDQGVIPSTYLPYINIPSTAYHPGFHSIAAFFIWLTNLDLSQALLILGQVLNAASVFPVYLLTKTLTRSSTAGLFAAVITAFFTPMPAYYTSWSRYTELTGLLILPVALAMINLWLGNSSNKRSIWIIILGAISAAGLFMVHYRVVAFMLFLVFSFVLYQSLFRTQSSAHKPAHIWLFSMVMAAIAIILVLPWFIPTLKNTVIPIARSSISTTVPFFQDFSWPYLTSALGKQALVLAGLGLVWSLFKQRNLAVINILWLIILFFLANLASLKLPGAGLISNSSVEIMLFIPISLLGGYFLYQLVSYWNSLIPKHLHAASYMLVIILVGYVSFLGAKQLIPIINPITILSRDADLSAIQWIDENIPAGETIVINPFSWGYSLYAGNDGGYWISPLAGRQTMPPPVLYGLSAGAEQISEQSQQIISLSANPALVREYLLSYQYHYVFTGARGGVISPQKLASSGLFSVLYHQDGVWILAVKP
jgi:hypothetical protein